MSEEEKKRAIRLLEMWKRTIAGNDQQHPQVVAIRMCMLDLITMFGITTKELEEHEI
jgi:hypothetical protein